MHRCTRLPARATAPRPPACAPASRCRPEGADEFGEPATRKATAQGAIERGETGGEGIGRHRRWGNDLLELGAELGYLHNDCGLRAYRDNKGST